MKKIIALALALIMALSMASVAFAADLFFYNDGAVTESATYAPGAKITVKLDTAAKGGKIESDFTTGTAGYKGASMIDTIKLDKKGENVVITLKESEKVLDEAREVAGLIKVFNKDKSLNKEIKVDIYVNNNLVEIYGAKKAADAEDWGKELWDAANTVFQMDEDGGYITFTDKVLTGTVKMEKNEKAFVSLSAIDADTKEALEEVLGEDYDAIVETYMMNGNGFKNAVDYTYKAYAEDPHYFYGFDGEKLFALDAEYDADEEVDAYVFTGEGAGVIVITDKEIVLAEEETKNPDTGANDVVGVAAALAVVSLVAAGAVSLKK